MTAELSSSAYSPTEDLVVPSPHYFMVADILGFTELIGKLDDDQQSQRVRDLG